MKKDSGPSRTKAHIHPESLLHHRLVRRAFTDRRLAPRPRGIDCAWRYNGVVADPVVGFNPFGGSFYYGVKSTLAEWLKAPGASARPLNTRDRLVYEVFFGVHDYLHVWTYGLIRELAPDLEMGFGRIHPRNFEALVFAHLLTEAVAVVGLDFWYLSTINANDVSPIGMDRQTFATSYHERDIAEYRRAYPDFEVQTPRFYQEIVTAYCTGNFKGFDANDLMRSPMLARWATHVVDYAQYMRSYIRNWLSYLAGSASYSGDSFRPLSISSRWHRSLVRDVGDALWDLVKHDKSDVVSGVDPRRTWRSPRELAPDARYVNVNRLDHRELARIAESAQSEVGFRWLFDQYISAFDFDAFDKEKLVLLPLIKRSRSFKALQAVTKGERRLPVSPNEPRDLFMLG